jgi:hypothetical protein
MAIDRTGKWWKGASSQDALEYLRALEPGGYTVDEVLEQSCQCGSHSFQVFRSDDDELSYLICSSCKTKTFITDSEEHVEDQKFKSGKCPCRNASYRVFLGVHSIKDPSVANWMSICVICDKCGVLGSPLDWEFDTDKADPSYAKHANPLPSKNV